MNELQESFLLSAIIFFFIGIMCYAFGNTTLAYLFFGSGVAEGVAVHITGRYEVYRK